MLMACGSEAEVRLGTGEIEFEPLEDGGTIPVVQGPQGGFHLVGSVVVAGIDPGDADDLAHPDNPTTMFEVVHEGTVLTTIATYVQGLETSTTEGYTHQMLNRFAILNIFDDDEVAGDMVTFSVTVSGARSGRATDSLELLVEKHPAND